MGGTHRGRRRARAGRVLRYHRAVTVPHIFVTRGDLTHLRADVVVLPTSTAVVGDGTTSEMAKLAWGEAAIEAGFEAIRDGARIREAGDASSFLLPHAGPGMPRAVVVVATVHGDPAPDEVRRAAHAAVLEAAAVLIRSRPGRPLGPDEKRGLVAMGAMATGEGGGADRAGMLARAQLEGIRDALSTHPELDVVVVAWSTDAWSRFVEARRALGLGPPASPRSAEIGRAIQADRCALFVGAGLSRGSALPDWGTLVARMCEAAGIAKSSEHAADYPALAERAVASGVDHLAVLRGLYGTTATHGTPPSLAHYLLLQLPFRYVVTTNYDGLVERAVHRLRRPHRRIVENHDVALSGEQDLVSIFKIHGHVDDERAVDVVLTSAEYEGFAERYPAKAALLQALLLNHHFFFVGYGLHDVNLNSIFGHVQRLLETTHRTAWATAIGEVGATTDGPVQWLGVENGRALALELDAIASACAGTTQTLFANLTHAPTERLGPLHRELRDAGAELEHLVHQALTRVEREAALATLSALTDLGWRPAQGGRFDLWRRLAHLSQDDADWRGRAWRAALADAERPGQLDEARRELEALTTTPPIPPSPSSGPPRSTA